MDGAAETIRGAAGKLVAVAVADRHTGNVCAPPGAAEAAERRQANVQRVRSADAGEPGAAREIAGPGVHAGRPAIDLRAGWKSHLDPVLSGRQRIDDARAKNFNGRRHRHLQH